MKCILIDTKVPKNTAEQVKKVAELKEKYPIVVDGILDTIEHITTEALDYLIQLKDQEQLNIKLEGKKDCYLELGVKILNTVPNNIKFMYFCCFSNWQN